MGSNPNIHETVWGRTKRKAKQNPFILPAAGMTVVSLFYMFKTMYKGDRVGFQKSQRFRVGSQFLAFVAFGLGAWYYSLPKNSEVLEETKKDGSDSL